MNECGFEITIEWVKPDRFFWKFTLLCWFQFASALGDTDINPVSRFVTGSLKAREFDKGFKKHWAVMIAEFPVFGDSPALEFG